METPVQVGYAFCQPGKSVFDYLPMAQALQPDGWRVGLYPRAGSVRIGTIRQRPGDAKIIVYAYPA